MMSLARGAFHAALHDLPVCAHTSPPSSLFLAQSGFCLMWLLPDCHCACDSDDEEDEGTCSGTNKGDAEKKGVKKEGVFEEGEKKGVKKERVEEEGADNEGADKEEGAEEHNATYLLDEVRCAAPCSRNPCTLSTLSSCVDNPDQGT